MRPVRQSDPLQERCVSSPKAVEWALRHEVKNAENLCYCATLSRVSVAGGGVGGFACGGATYACAGAQCWHSRPFVLILDPSSIETHLPQIDQNLCPLFVKQPASISRRISTSSVPSVLPSTSFPRSRTCHGERDGERARAKPTERYPHCAAPVPGVLVAGRAGALTQRSGRVTGVVLS